MKLKLWCAVLANLCVAVAFGQTPQQNLAGLAQSLTSPGVVPITNGGTGVTTAAAAIQALLPSYVSSECLSNNGSTLVWQSCGGGGGTPGGSNYQLQYNNSGVFGGIALGTSGYPLLSAGAGGPAAFGPLNLASAVTGNLSVTNLASGTNAGTATYWRGDGTWSTPPGASYTFQTNGTGLASSSTINFENSSATNGVTLTFTNSSAGNVQLGWSGTVAVAGGGIGATSFAAAGVSTFTGAITATDCPEFSNTTGTLQDSGAPCGSLSGPNNTIACNNSGGTAALDACNLSTVLGVLTSGTANAQTGNYTFQSSDGNGQVNENCSSACTVTIPPNASVGYNIGTLLTLYSSGTAAATLAPGSGVTITGPWYGSSTTQTYAVNAYGSIQIQKTATNSWQILSWQAPAMPTAGAAALSGTCTHSANSGVLTGTVTLSSVGGCTIILTLSAVQPGAHGWLGTMGDSTQPTLPVWRPTSWTTTTVTFTVPAGAASSDVLTYGPLASF